MHDATHLDADSDLQFMNMVKTAQYLADNEHDYRVRQRPSLDELREIHSVHELENEDQPVIRIALEGERADDVGVDHLAHDQRLADEHPHEPLVSREARQDAFDRHRVFEPVRADPRGAKHLCHSTGPDPLAEPITPRRRDRVSRPGAYPPCSQLRATARPRGKNAWNVPPMPCENHEQLMPVSTSISATSLVFVHVPALDHLGYADGPPNQARQPMHARRSSSVAQQRRVTSRVGSYRRPNPKGPLRRSVRVGSDYEQNPKPRVHRMPSRAVNQSGPWKAPVARHSPRAGGTGLTAPGLAALAFVERCAERT